MTDKLKPVRAKIVIDETEGPGGTPLKQCFFMSTDLYGAYNIYDSEAKLLAAYVVSGADFNLTVNGAHFFISNFKIDEIAASGSWSIGHHEHLRGADDFEPDGTFQASSGGGDGESEVAKAISCTIPANAIVVKNVTGGSDGAKLKKCFFLPLGGDEYSLSDKNCNVLVSDGIVSGVPIHFTLDSINWTVIDFVIDDSAASGTWVTPSAIEKEQDGSFQASSGGGLGEKEAASAASA